VSIVAHLHFAAFSGMPASVRPLQV
jgi:hypothetical protein